MKEIANQFAAEFSQNSPTNHYSPKFKNIKTLQRKKTIIYIKQQK